MSLLTLHHVHRMALFEFVASVHCDPASSRCHVEGIGLGAVTSTASAQVGVATWNVAWLMDADTHGRWTKACQAIGWSTEDELKAKGLPLPKELVGLPYCDVHDGIDYNRKAECLKIVGPCLKNPPNVLDSPDGECLLSPDRADWSAFETKRRTLHETLRAMDRDGVTLIGLSEVFGEAAARQILPTAWKAAARRQDHRPAVRSLRPVHSTQALTVNR